MTTSIAIIGAGMSGLAAAHQLQQQLPNATISIFEKSRGVGRMATRYKDAFQFDFGAPHFRVKTEVFHNFLAPFIENGAVNTWQPQHVAFTATGIQPVANLHPYYISSPKMTSLGRAIASELTACNIHYKTRVISLHKYDNTWHLVSEDNNNLGSFDWVICTAPTAQAVDLLPNSFEHLTKVKNSKIDACFTLMLGWESAVVPDVITSAEWDMMTVDVADSPIEKVVRENRKHAFKKHTKSGMATSLSIFSKNTWAEQQVDADQSAVKAALTDAVSKLLNIDAHTANHCDMHRWRYAKPHTSQAWQCLVDTENQLIAAGDWCLNGSVEAAYLSGQSAADAIIQAAQHT